MSGTEMQQVESDLGISLPNLIDAAELSERLVRQARDHLTQQVAQEGDDADVLVFGSIARHEATPGSDFDFLVVVHRLPQDVQLGRKLINASLGACEALGLDPPGVTGLFGRVAAAADLTERIGLQEDTNANHSIRMLVLEESVSIYRPELHDDVLRAILTRYLLDQKTDARVPRFLLNDLIRYWRTLAVDYQAKRWVTTKPEGWGLRYLKLIISRKLVFAGTLASLFLVEPPEVEKLFKEFKRPSLLRLAQLHTVLEEEQRSALGRILTTADRFVGFLADETFRENAEKLTNRIEVQPDSNFDEMLKSARRLQSDLESVFFDSEALGDKTKRYISF